MKKVSFLYKIIIGILLILIIFSNFIYTDAAEITEEKIVEAIKSAYKETDVSIMEDYENNKIHFKMENIEVDLNYEIGENIKLWVDKTITNGIDYETYSSDQTVLLISSLGYAAVANISDDINFNNANFYMGMSVISEILKNGESIDLTSNKYIVDEIRETEVDSQTGQVIINKKDFGDYAVEYAKYYNKTPITVNDKENGIDSYIYKQYIKSETDSSVTITGELIVNPNADFKQLNKMSDEFLNDFNNISNEGILEKAKNTVINNDKNHTSNVSNIPQTGTSFSFANVLQIIIAVSVLGIILIALTGKQYKNVD